MARAYGRKFQVGLTNAAKVPAGKESQVAAGGHLKGCRIGFDLGASDYKVSAVMDGKAIFTEEAPWQPVIQSNPGISLSSFVGGLASRGGASAARGRHRRQFRRHHGGQ